VVRTTDSRPEGRGFESRRICEQDTLKSTAQGSQNKQNCLALVKKKEKESQMDFTEGDNAKTDLTPS
jgi:hypothetical protein